MTDAIQETVKRSIQTEPKQDRRISLVLWQASTDNVLSPWWSSYRDRQLRVFWKTVDYLEGAVYALESRLATIPFKITPKDYSATAHQKQAEKFEEMILYGAEFGQGWEVFFSKWVEDLLTQDNGAFAEIIGDGDPLGPIIGMPIGFAHLDAARCERTSNPEFPVVYIDAEKRYRLHYTRVAFASLQPSPMKEMNNVGLCAISKCLNVSQSMLDVLVYKQEKLGSRPTRSIMIGKGGLDADVIKEAFGMAAESMDNVGLSRFSKSVVLGDAAHPDAGLEMVDIASLPDGFDYQTDIMVGMATIALAFGVDARELFPMMGGGATRADALIQHLKARVKGIGHLLTIAENTFTPKLLPPTLEWTFDYSDDAQDRQVAEIKKMRSDRHSIDLSNETVDERTAREQMLGVGDLTEEQFERLELIDGRLEDGTPILSLFFDPEYEDLLALPVPNPLDVELNDPEDMKIIISAKREELLQALGVLKNFRIRRQINTALHVLGFLEGEYDGQVMADLRDMIPDPVEGDDADGDGVTLDEGNEEPTGDDVTLDESEE